VDSAGGGCITSSPFIDGLLASLHTGNASKLLLFKPFKQF